MGERTVMERLTIKPIRTDIFCYTDVNGKVWLNTKSFRDGHFSCLCGEVFFEAERKGHNLILGCPLCSREKNLDLIEGRWDDTSALDDGKLYCPKCNSKLWAFIKSGETVSLGCKKCSYDKRIIFDDTPRIII